MIIEKKVLMKIVASFLFCYTLIVFNSCASSDGSYVFKYSNEQPEAAIRSQSMLFLRKLWKKKRMAELRWNCFLGVSLVMKENLWIWFLLAHYKELEVVFLMM